MCLLITLTFVFRTKKSLKVTASISNIIIQCRVTCWRLLIRNTLEMLPAASQGFHRKTTHSYLHLCKKTNFQVVYIMPNTSEYGSNKHNQIHVFVFFSFPVSIKHTIVLMVLVHSSYLQTSACRYWLQRLDFRRLSVWSMLTAGQ